MSEGYDAPPNSEPRSANGSRVFTGGLALAFDTFCPMRSDPVFRTIETSDLDRVLAINAASVPEVGDINAADLDFLVSEAAIALVAECDHTLVGFCIVLAPGSTYTSVNYRWFMELHPDSLYLDRVAFDASSRGRGWGRAMYDEVARRMRDEFTDATGLTLEVNIDPPNDPSLRFHRKQGFVEVGRQMSHGIEVSLMHRPVLPPAID